MQKEDEHGSNVTLQDIIAQRRSRNIRNAIIGVAVLVLLGGISWWLMSGESEPLPAPAPPPPVIPQPEPPPLPPLPPPPDPVIPPPPPPPPPALPELDGSDPLVRESVAPLSESEALSAWLVPDELLRRFVAAVDNVAEGRSPRKQLRPLWPKKKFRVREDNGRLVITTSSWARYDTLTDVFVNLDPDSTVAVYRELQPLFEQAYDELGYQDRTFDEALVDAIDELLRAPAVVGDAEVKPKVISWEYADSDLESLSHAQRALLRTGPMNAPRIQTQLRALAAALGIEKSALPRRRVHTTGRGVE